MCIFVALEEASVLNSLADDLPQLFRSQSTSPCMHGAAPKNYVSRNSIKNRLDNKVTNMNSQLVDSEKK